MGDDVDNSYHSSFSVAWGFEGEDQFSPAVCTVAAGVGSLAGAGDLVSKFMVRLECDS